MSDPPRPSAAVVLAAEKQLVEQQRIVEYDTKEFTIELLVQKLGTMDDKGEISNDGDIYVPSYQRAFTWKLPRRSRFIESVLMGLPIPFLFFGSMIDGRLEIVDGVQRLRTCAAFLNNRLELGECERLTKLEGFRFSDLPKSQQRHFKNHTIRAVVLSKNADEEDRRDLFDRINTGPLVATPAEIRRGSKPGLVTALIVELAVDTRFVKLCPMTESSQNLRVREDMVTRFFTLSEQIQENLPKYKDRPREYLDSWLETANRDAKIDAKLIAERRAKFTTVMSFVEQHFPCGFAKKKNSQFTPNVRFDAIAVGVAEALRLRPKLKPRIPPSEWLDSPEFIDVTTSSAANVRSHIVNRIEFVRARLLER